MTLTNLQKAEQERASHQTNLALFQDELKDHATTPLGINQVNIIITGLQKMQIGMEENNLKIHNCSPTDIDTYERDYNGMMRKIMKLTADFMDIKDAWHMANPSTASSASSSSSTSSTSTSEIRLPRLDLPTFNGDGTQWLSFVDQFKAAVDNSTKLSGSQKMTYLKASLKGDASKVIGAMTATDANYAIAWNSLKDRYQNDREIVFSILRKFFGQTTITGESAKTIRSLIDVSKECIRSLTSLNLPIDQWDVILVFVMLQKLDSATRQEWELDQKNSDLPKMTPFLEFLEQRARALASSGPGKPVTLSKASQDARNDSNPSKRVQAHHVEQVLCKLCNETHFHHKCPKFIVMNSNQRREVAAEHGLCYNCLRTGHPATKCSSKHTCKTCKGKHHSMLHIEKSSNQAKGETVNSTAESVSSYHAIQSTPGQGMLATATIVVIDSNDRPHLCRAFLDGGATSSFITDNCARRLGLKRTHASSEVNGIASSSINTVKGMCNAKFRSYFYIPGDESFDVAMLILPNITSRMPAMEHNPKAWPHLQGIQLADENFFKPGRIDILLGSDIFWSLLKDGKRVGQPGSPIGINSKLGWLIAGTVKAKAPEVSVHYADTTLDAQLQKFWVLESVPSARVYTPEERRCEEHFVQTHTRTPEGRFVVSFPFKKAEKPIGAIRDIAVRRLLGLERRLSKFPEHRKEYNAFMDEYLRLGHMEMVKDIQPSLSPSNNIAGVSNPFQNSHQISNSSKPQESSVNPIPSSSSNQGIFYIPHQFVLKPTSTSTKFRVVFDASCKSSTGISLNDTLMVGPTIQDNLFNILVRFRKHPIAFTADITKMYRQILMNPQDRDWQRILWRNNPKEEIKEYRLNTVTYGTASGSFHATRVIKELAELHKSDLPLGASVAKDDFYVDDLMSGGETVEGVKDTIQQTIERLEKGQMQIRKFSSNHPSVLAALPEELRETQIPMSLDKDDAIKTLGLHWNPGMDKFIFKVNLSNINSLKPTKRTLLSEMARTFDPLGWLSPITIRAKILFQQMWKTETGWDDLLPDNILQAWNEYKSNLPCIEDIGIPRCIVPEGSPTLTLHGFADASERAYAAVVYVKSEKFQAPTLISLTAAKTKVAPVKPITLPRLELCAALLLVKLLKLVQESLKTQFKEIFAWSDSTVVLSWIRGHPSRWKTFVANRVTEIQEEEDIQWGHVAGTSNPADCASRGISPHELPNHPLWWNGPSWLRDPTTIEIPSVTPEEQQLIDAEEKRTVMANMVIPNAKLPLFYCSSLTKLKRLTAWWMRIIRCWRPLCTLRKDPQNKSAIQEVKKIQGPLTSLELNDAFLYWVKEAQHDAFQEEIKCLNKKTQLPKSSKLKSLSPYLDSNNIIRVGGRLKHAKAHSDLRNPLLLPKRHRLTDLIVHHEHISSLHGGPQLMMSNIQRRFWIIGGKNVIRFHYGKCVICVRNRAQVIQQPMADLPKSRVTQTRPFLTCGVDYAGPFSVRAIPSRSKVTFKAYLTLFICFSTRAIHLEVVSSMTTEAFLAAFKRFIARRGKCRDIHSDCGTNFVGASKELKELKKLVESDAHNQTLTSVLANEDMTWHFNPPGAPHFGGLWEAGVKSVKYHLHRIIGTSRLTFEELSTVMTQVEACLNSRPLMPLSTDPSDLSALTPGHFLIGDALLAYPEPDLTLEKVNRLTRWQLMQQMFQHFWKRWSKEYLTRLQQRPKWLKPQVQIEIGNLVAIKEENLHPLKWRLGRIIKLTAGVDGVKRVATIKTLDGEIIRPVAKLCLLPIPNPINESTEDQQEDIV